MNGRGKGNRQHISFISYDFKGILVLDFSKTGGIRGCPYWLTCIIYDAPEVALQFNMLEEIYSKLQYLALSIQAYNLIKTYFDSNERILIWTSCKG